MIQLHLNSRKFAFAKLYIYDDMWRYFNMKLRNLHLHRWMMLSSLIRSNKLILGYIINSIIVTLMRVASLFMAVNR